MWMEQLTLENRQGLQRETGVKKWREKLKKK